MRTSIRCSTISRFTVAAAAMWMYGTGSAWAGGGGESLTSLQTLISEICSGFGITNCPDPPTVTQAVLAVAALENSPPEMVRALNNILPGSALDAGNAAAVPPCSDVPTPFPFNSTTVPRLFGTTTITCSGQTIQVPGLLSTLTPLGFMQGTPATPVPPYTSDANTLLYAVATGTTVASTGLTEPTMLDVLIEDVSRTNQTFVNQQIVAKTSVPLGSLNSDGTENPAVITTLEVVSTCTGGPSCLQAFAVGGIGSLTNPIAVAKLGINFAAVFSASQISATPHLFLEFAIPHLATQANDPLYFWFASTGSMGPINLAIPSAFFPPDDDGSCPGASSLGCIGITPNPGPLVSATTGSPIFALCANLPGGNGNGQAPVPSVSAYYALATNGEALISRALSTTSVCPF